MTYVFILRKNYGYCTVSWAVTCTVYVNSWKKELTENQSADEPQDESQNHHLQQVLYLNFQAVFAISKIVQGEGFHVQSELWFHHSNIAL